MGYLQDIFPMYNSEMDGSGKGFYKHGLYADVYEELLTPYIDKEITLVEIGTGRGGSLQVWKKFLGSKVKIYGIDHKGELFYTEPQIIDNFLADQSNKEALEKIPLNNIDVFIDDASHESLPTINTFEVFFPRLNSKGLYIIEDVGTAYRKDYGGGFRSQKSYMEYFKHIVDILNINEWGELLPTQKNMREIIEDLIPINSMSILALVDKISFYMGMIVVRKK